MLRSGSKMKNKKVRIFLKGAGIAQSVSRLATGWMAKQSEFESRQGQEFFLLHVVQTGSRFHQT
jgi:hypothetical protein